MKLKINFLMKIFFKHTLTKTKKTKKSQIRLKFKILVHICGFLMNLCTLSKVCSIHVYKNRLTHRHEVSGIHHYNALCVDVKI